MRWPAAVIILMLLLAGCTSKDSGGSTPDEDTSQATVGAISGATVTPTITPIKDAVVTLEPGGQSDDVGIFGNFRFEALPPGTYRLLAQAEGFLPAEETVVVEAGKTASLRIVMQYDIAPEPRRETLTFSGYFSADFGAVDDVAGPVKDAAQTGNCTCVFDIDPPRYLAGLTIEAVWDDDVEGAEATFGWNVTYDTGSVNGSGSSPLHGVMGEGLNLTGLQSLEVRMLPDATRPTYDQRFDLYVTLWEVDLPDPSFSALE